MNEMFEMHTVIQLKSNVSTSNILNSKTFQKIVAAIRGMHVSPAKHSYMRDYNQSVTTGQTRGQTDVYKVIQICHFASQATQKASIHLSNFYNLQRNLELLRSSETQVNDPKLYN